MRDLKRKGGEEKMYCVGFKKIKEVGLQNVNKEKI